MDEPETLVCINSHGVGGQSIRSGLPEVLGSGD
jgi:hypothetical protein